MLHFCDKSWIDWNEDENGREMRVHKVNRRMDVCLNRKTYVFTVHRNSDTKIYFCVKMCLVE